MTRLESASVYTMQEDCMLGAPEKSMDILRLLGRDPSPVGDRNTEAIPRAFNTNIKILNTPDGKGRGVFASCNLPRGTLLEAGTVLAVTPEQHAIPQSLNESIEKDYVFVSKRRASLSVGLGEDTIYCTTSSEADKAEHWLLPFSSSSASSTFNHAKFPNVSFTIDKSTQAILYTLCKDVIAGEELCTSYGLQASSGSGETTDSEEETLVDGWEALTAVNGLIGDEDQAGPIQKVRRGTSKSSIEESSESQELIPFKELPCQKVTTEICFSDLPLETTAAWVVDIEAKYAATIFELLRLNNMPTAPLQHLKRIKRLSAAHISVLVHPIEPPIPDSLMQILCDHPNILVPPYQTAVPIRPAVTREQMLEFATCWPAIFVPVRIGRSAEILQKGWKRDLLDWVRTMLNRVERLANEARLKGELPIASLVASSVLGPPLAESVDTRKSTGSRLCHSVPHVIDAVAAIDRAGGRLSSGESPPYLLSGLSLFTTHEPCLMCSMSLLHSRIAVVYYIRKSPHAGGLGSVYQVHEDKGLNHKFQAWQWTGGEANGLGEDDKTVEVDP